MKKFKKIALGLLGATVLSLGLYACSNDNETIEDAQSKYTILNSNDITVESVVKEKFNKGRKIAFKNIEGDFVLSELLFADLNRVAYIIEDAKTKEFLYFADKNFKSDEMVFQNIKTQENDVFSKISSDSLFKNTNRFDFIYIIDQIQLGSPVALGWSKRFSMDRLWKNNEENCGNTYRVSDPSSSMLGNCVQDCTFRSYRFFIGGKKTEIPEIPTGSNDC